MGAFAQGIGGLPDVVLPQVSGALLNARGLNVFGQQPKLPKGEKFNPTEATLNTVMESLVPGVQIARRLMEGGRSSYDNSTVFHPKTKPGTSRGGAAGKVFNPLNPVYLRRKKAQGSALDQAIDGKLGSSAGVPPAVDAAIDKALAGR